MAATKSRNAGGKAGKKAATRKAPPSRAAAPAAKSPARTAAKPPARTPRKPAKPAKPAPPAAVKSVPARRPRPQPLTQQGRRAAIKDRLDKIGPDLFDLFVEIDESRRTFMASGVRFYYNLGQRLLRPAEKYGDSGIDGLAWATQINRGTIAGAMRMASTMTEAEVRDYIDLCKRSGREASHTAMFELAKIADKSKRRALFDESIAQNLNTKELRDRVERHFGGKRQARGQGRSFKVPTTFDGNTSAMIKAADSFNRYTAQWVDPFVAACEAVPPDEYTPELVERLMQLEKMTEQAAQAAADVADRVAAFTIKVKDRLYPQGAVLPSSAREPAPMPGPTQEAEAPTEKDPDTAYRESLVAFHKPDQGPPARTKPRIG